MIAKSKSRKTRAEVAPKPQSGKSRRVRVARSKRRIRDPSRSRAAIFAAAEHIFNTKGYFATNSNEIVRAAGYAPGSFYTHFPNKLAVFLAAYEAWVGREWAEVNAAMRAPGKADDRIACAIAALARHHKASRVFRRSLRALAATVTAVRDAQNAQRAQQIVWLKALCASEGLPRPTNETCAIALFSIERVLDALAEGDMRALEANEATVLKDFARVVAQLLSRRA
jgi:AcrR family transcriptional regulator